MNGFELDDRVMLKLKVIGTRLDKVYGAGGIILEKKHRVHLPHVLWASGSRTYEFSADLRPMTEEEKGRLPVIENTTPA